MKKEKWSAAAEVEKQALAVLDEINKLREKKAITGFNHYYLSNKLKIIAGLAAEGFIQDKTEQ